MVHSSNHSCFDIKTYRNEQILLARNHTAYETSNQAILMLASTMGQYTIFRNLAHSLEECTVFDF